MNWEIVLPRHPAVELSAYNVITLRNRFSNDTNDRNTLRNGRFVRNVQSYRVGRFRTRGIHLFPLLL